MKHLYILTPVKDSIESTLDTIRSVMASHLDVPFTYTIYNDFSSKETTMQLEKAQQQYGFRLINLADITSHPSPNYLLVLQMAQEEALRDDAALLIVESDVVVKPDTLQHLVAGSETYPQCGIAAAVTVNENGVINYPYEYALGKENKVIDSKKHCSFCCSLLSQDLLKAFDFHSLDASKNWFDVTISHKSLDLGLHNYLFTNLPVWHRPHASRPWKQLKYKNPLKYYWLKFTKGLDKI